MTRIEKKVHQLETVGIFKTLPKTHLHYSYKIQSSHYNTNVCTTMLNLKFIVVGLSGKAFERHLSSENVTVIDVCAFILGKANVVLLCFSAILL